MYLKELVNKNELIEKLKKFSFLINIILIINKMKTKL